MAEAAVPRAAPLPVSTASRTMGSVGSFKILRVSTEKPACLGMRQTDGCSGASIDLDSRLHVHMFGSMDSSGAIAIFSALAQTARLEVFKLLVRREPHGLPAGEIARELDTPHNTMSAHLGILSRAGLIVGERHSRSIIYRANLDQLREVTLYLVKDCCGGRPELCAPLIADLSCCATAFPEIV